VGAFADASSTREARSKAEKLGLKTYTQDVDTPNGKRTRVRVGPFTTREEAQKAAAKLRAANLQASVLAL
jgi:DedD protein